MHNDQHNPKPIPENNDTCILCGKPCVTEYDGLDWNGNERWRTWPHGCTLQPLQTLSHCEINEY